MRTINTLILTLLVGLAIACGGRPPTVTQQEPRPTRTREQFRKEFMGATEKELLEKLGRPYRTDPEGDGSCWAYKETTLDSISDRPDLLTFVYIRDGKVYRISP